MNEKNKMSQALYNFTCFHHPVQTCSQNIEIAKKNV